MDYKYLLSNTESAALLSLIPIYMYLFTLYREKHMGIWSIGWSILFLRIVLLDSGVVAIRDAQIGLLVYELQSIGACVLFMWGANSFSGNITKRLWTYSAIVVSIISTILAFTSLPILIKLSTAACFVGITYIWTGVVFNRLQTSKLGKHIVSSAYILWGIHTLNMPLLLNVTWFAPWGFFLGSILRIMIAFGILVVYFETRSVLIKTDRMNIVGKMAVNVAHRIRNPLTAVSGYLQRIISKNEYCKHKSMFKTILEELNTTNDTVREYLLLSNDRRAELKNLNLNEILKKLLPLMQSDAAVIRVNVKLELGNVTELYLDEYEIRYLVLQLVRNGLDVMPNGGELTICTFSDSDTIVLSIHDQGNGIPPHIIDYLGTPFVTTKFDGGLGLPICYSIADRHHAFINFKTSETGTTFFVHFKIACSVA
ncbi:ATP-binding protein [Pelosinus baikalensis]|uniref:histidine kinase n=1 Tax=Pelosinus baikalensis TaxID=2892015 RepID=A0ABS8HYJ2_9FIRM|nr:ATP-binding protein [Pelosinus baikalensis]MCC5467579.1 hypothetical protein [Pelosinus baikalensis]